MPCLMMLFTSLKLNRSRLIHGWREKLLMLRSSRTRRSGGEEQAKLILGITEATKNLKSVVGEQRLHVLPGVFVTIFGVDGLILAKLYVKVEIGDSYALVAQAYQVHLDPTSCRIPHRPMSKCRDRKSTRLNSSHHSIS